METFKYRPTTKNQKATTSNQPTQFYPQAPEGPQIPPQPAAGDPWVTDNQEPPTNNQQEQNWTWAVIGRVWTIENEQTILNLNIS